MISCWFLFYNWTGISADKKNFFSKYPQTSPFLCWLPSDCTQRKVNHFKEEIWVLGNKEKNREDVKEKWCLGKKESWAQRWAVRETKRTCECCPEVVHTKLSWGILHVPKALSYTVQPAVVYIGIFESTLNPAFLAAILCMIWTIRKVGSNPG